MRRQTVIGTAVLLAMTAAGFAWAQPGDGGGGRGGGRGGWDPEKRVERMIEQLELSDDQAEKVRAIHENGQKERGALQKDLARLRNQIEAEMLKDAVNKQSVIRLTKQVGEKRTEMAVMRIEHQFQIRELLTPEQRDKFVAMHGKGRHGGEHGRHGQRQGRGGPR